MATASDIGANFSQYTGDVNLGGGSFGVGRLDTRPIEDLARYTFLYNKSEYDQRQKDAEAAAAQIADYMSYDLVNGIPKFSKQLQDKNDKLLKFISENPDAINYRNRKAWTEYQRLKGDLSNDIAAAKLNETIFMARRKEVENEVLPLEKQRLQKNLDKDIEALNIRDRLKYTDKFDVKPIEVGAAPIRDIQNTDIGRNFTGQATTKLPDMRIARNTASGVANGLLKIVGDKGQFGDQYEADVASGKLEPVLSSQYFNAAIQKYKSDPKYLNTDGTLNIDKVIADDSGIVGRNLENVKAFNLYMRSIKDRINQGYFKDNFGGQLRFTNDASGLSERDYKEINIDDGYSPDEIVLTKMLAQTPGISRTIKLDETDLGIKQGNLRVAQGNLGVNQGELELKRLAAGWKKNSKGGWIIPLTPSADAAADFGNIIYGVSAKEVKKIDPSTGKPDPIGGRYKMVNGALVDAKGNIITGKGGIYLVPASDELGGVNNSIVNEFNKYSGAQKYDPTTGQIITAASASRIKVNDEGFFTVLVGQDGVIQGIKTADEENAKGEIIEGSGTFADVNEFQGITTKSSQKGATKYIQPVDISGGQKIPASKNKVTDPKLLKILNQ